MIQTLESKTKKTWPSTPALDTTVYESKTEKQWSILLLIPLQVHMKMSKLKYLSSTWCEGYDLKDLGKAVKKRTVGLIVYNLWVDISRHGGPYVSLNMDWNGVMAQDVVVQLSSLTWIDVTCVQWGWERNEQFVSLCITFRLIAHNMLVHMSCSTWIDSTIQRIFSFCNSSD